MKQFLTRSTRGVVTAARAVRAVTTPLGTTVAVLAVLGLGLGWWYAWTELTALGVAALVCLLLGTLFLIGRTQYDVVLSLAGTRVVVGDRAAGKVHIRNARGRAVLPTRVELPVGKGLAGFAVPKLAAGATHEELFTIPTERRSVVVVGPVRSVRGDPLGIFRREMPWGSAQELYVHPRTINLDKVTSGFLRDLDGHPVPDLSDSDVAFHALREYVAGDDRRSVHWRSSARTGQLMVRQYEETRRWHLAVALSTARSDYADSDEFELAVSVAGSVGMHAIIDGRELTVMTHERGLHTMSPTTLLDQLSGVECSDRPDSIVELAQDVATNAPDASIVFLLSGGELDVAKLKSAQARLPLGALSIAVHVHTGAEATRHRIGDLTVLTVGALADLPRALRSVKSVRS